MLSKYELFCRILELGSFTRAADQLNYSQSAVSQTIKALEKELGTTLLDRSKEGLSLTSDGARYYPYFKAIYASEKALNQKHKEMQGLEDVVIQIGTFTSVSRNLLIPLMREFKVLHPQVQYNLKQGDYTNIPAWIEDEAVDFGFINSNNAPQLEFKSLYKDNLLAVLPSQHPLTKKKTVSLCDLAAYPFILLDEGLDNVTLAAFAKQGLTPNLAYKVYDDYTILEMVRQGFGVSALYEKMLAGLVHHTITRPIAEEPQRTISLAWKNWETMSYASRRFAEFIIKNTTGA